MNPSQSHSNRKPYNWLIYKNYDRFLKKYAEYYSGTLYDLGCGEMPYKTFVLQYVKHYIGVDWPDSFHKFKADITADLNKSLPIKSASGDTVISLSVMEHLHEPQVMLFEVYRILKSGGRLILQVPWQWWVHERPYDFFRYTPYGLTYIFEKAGFVDVVVEPEAGFFTMWVLKLNYFSLRFIRGPKPMRGLIKAGLLPFWYIGQTLAPPLDKLDRNWALETTGYFVTARKP
jgi:SAM-dependent methyltransferase